MSATDVMSQDIGDSRTRNWVRLFVIFGWVGTRLETRLGGSGAASRNAGGVGRVGLPWLLEGDSAARAGDLSACSGLVEVDIDHMPDVLVRLR